MPNLSAPRALGLGSDASLWVRNVQLAVFGIPQAAFFVFTTQRAALESAGLFAGFTPAVWSVVMLRALGGLIVAAVSADPVSLPHWIDRRQD
eukprot:scaffold239144_cov31-Tisochrysis_lutea.AAC.2